MPRTKHKALDDSPAPGSKRIVPKIACQLCGREMLRITQKHLNTVHDGMLYDDYLKEFGPESTALEVYAYRGGTVARAMVNDPHLRQEIYDLAQKGYHIRTIAATVGIGNSTIDLWLDKGKPDNINAKTGERLYADIYYEFYKEFRRHEALAETKAVDALVKATTGDWKAAMAFLERRFPRHWHQTSTSTVSVEGQVEHVHVRDLEVQALLEDPETAEMACKLLELLSTSDRSPDTIIDAELEDDVDIDRENDDD